jgi:dolichol-phosphate mannosyltransferase
MEPAVNAAVVAPASPAAHETASQARPAPVLAIVVPTFRERDNVAELVRRLDATLVGIPWEVVFVDDDSPDGTADTVRELGRRDPRVRCLHRIGRRGLSSACVEGVLATSAETVAVMDADLQHDETILPEMLRAIRERGADVAVGSRYVAGGGIGEWDEGRARISRFATRISRVVVPEGLADPMSGFFMVRRDVFMDAVRDLSSLGFKILVDLFASSPRALNFVEVPYRFRERHAGESKLDNRVAWDFGMLLLDKVVGRWVPVRFLSFAMIGGLGVVVHMVVLAALFRTGLAGFGTGQAVASAVAMVFNFFLNNALTYRDSKLEGAAMVRGLLVFMLVCGLGAVANVGVADWLFSEHRQGWVVAALAGILVGAVWNYTTSSFYTWGRRGR